MLCFKTLDIFSWEISLHESHIFLNIFKGIHGLFSSGSLFKDVCIAGSLGNIDMSLQETYILIFWDNKVRDASFPESDLFTF